ncbi:MAG: DNA polymerase III subunit alpha, partial [Candidatus Omnitrophica bacterium]|nr:DNA polymerase III subunit alpha [Candidatus Omnitrophota bacterium]
IFGKDNFYLELMENGLPEQNTVNKTLIDISKDLNVPLIATNDVHYLEPEAAIAQEVLLCIQTQTNLADPNRFKFNSNSLYFRSPEEMKRVFSHVPEAISNTVEVAKRCNLILDFSKIHLPLFPLPQGQTEEGYLRSITYNNLANRYKKETEEIKQRIEYELDVISKTGFSSYFLIVWDLIKFAKENDVPVGPGRGSAAGSIVSYLLGITDIDPLRYDLLFERFLNPARISMPDIDIDFCYEKRLRMLDYVAEKYGTDCVAQIITFGSMLARAVVRDVGRAMGISYGEVDKIAKMIPAIVGQKIDLKEALKTSPELAEVYKSDASIKRLIDVAVQLEGLSRHSSTHAAGVVISDKPIMDRVPVIKGSQGESITAYDMSDLEKCGMLKMDFLGLKTLTVIEETLKIIKRTKNIALDISSISLKDKKTFDLLSNAFTIGVFQLESRGMREILTKMVPTKFEDLIAVLALYRPGPLGSGMVDDFIDRKLGKKPVSYIHPMLASILKETYGIILYQEQTMKIVSVLAGFDLAAADLLRKAIGKKVPEIMDEQRTSFVSGCKKNRINEETATKIFDLIDYFSGYGFNKSHSTAYALISYRTAYLKANYPTEFMAALLTSERNNTDKIVEYINESERINIRVLPPDINTSFTNFTVTDDANIRFGLMAIKNVGNTALESIIEVRRDKPFESIFDFSERVDSRTVNKKVVESLIKSGAMDSFGLKRSQMLAISDSLISKNTKKRDVNQLMLFESTNEIPIPDLEELPLIDILTYEKALLGIYLTSHPLNTFSGIVKYLSRRQISSLYDDARGGDVVICGVIEKTKFLTTRRKNQRMAILKLEDETASVEVVVFPRLFEEKGFIVKEKSVILLKGKAETKEKMPKVLAEDIIPMENVLSQVKEVNLSIYKEQGGLNKLRDIFSASKGLVPVCFTLKDSKLSGIKIKTGENYSLTLNPDVLAAIGAIVGGENLSLKL